MARRIQVGGRIESEEVGGIVTGAAEILDDAKEKKQSVINQETDDELLRLDQSKQDNLTFDNAPTEGSDNPVKSGGVYAADKALSDAIEAILLLIPSAASALNKLVDTAMMNSSISTATATFRGTYNVVTDLSLTVDATHEQIAAALGNVISTADNNDYAFVQIPVSAESTDIRRTERYKFNGTAWGYEYDLNTSGFTAAQWAAINSGITIALVGKLIGLPTSSELQALLGQKQNTLTFDNIPVSGSANPVKSGGVYSSINDEKTAREQLAQTVTGIDGRVGDVEEVIPTGAAANNKLVANNSMEAYVTSIINAITASFTIATTDGHISLTLTQTNGQVASLTLTSSDIASAQALTTLTGRVTTAESNITTLGGRVSTNESNITTLGGRVSTNESDIANLQQLYNDLQQSKPEPVTELPSTGQQQGVIYRLAGTTSYSDYMWNGSTWVLMATYNNAIDPRPKKASQNLVTSGGVFDNMGALDVSELNATENPHTLAKYADLSAALAAIPTDYQKGGMSIKFVQSSDNKYVQYRLMSDTFNTTPANWQGVDDEPTAGSDNLVKSGGIAASVESLKNAFGVVKETILTDTVLAYNIDIAPREEAYTLHILVESNRIGQAPVYRTINGVQEDSPTNLNIGSYNVLEIPSNTSRLRFVRIGLSANDKFVFTLVESSELREKYSQLYTNVVNNDSVFINTFDVDKGTPFNPTEPIKNAVKWIKLYDYTEDFYAHKQIGLSECKLTNNTFSFVIWNYTDNVRLANLSYAFSSAEELANAGRMIIGSRNAKCEVCFDFEDFNFTLGSIAAGTSTNDYAHRGINIDKCIKDTLVTYKSVFVPTASFIKGGFDITRMISNTIKYLKVRDNSIKIPKIGLSELIWFSNTTILSIKLWDFTNNVELCKFSGYYTAQEINKVRTNLISTNGKWEISIDLTEMNFDVYSVIDSNLDSPFSYEARGFDTSMILTNNLIGEQWNLTKIDDYTNYQGGIIRKTNSKVEDSSGTAWGFVYFPVENGKTYRIIGTSVNVYAAAWAVLAFDTKVPESGDSITVIQSYDSDGFKKFDIRYTAPANGYLLASYFHSDGVQGVPLIYKFIEYGNIDAVIPAINEYPLVYEGLSKAEKSFKVGGVSFRALTNGVTSFVPDAFAEQYEPQYAKYLCEAPSKRYGKLIVDDTINMFDASLDAENYKNSYCRQIIGVDSEGWVYIAQRLCIYDFETDEKTKILRTKDFITFDVFMEGVVGVQLIELENGELCFAANSTDTYDGVTGYYCNIYVTSNNKTVINKRFHTTRTQNGAVGQPWSWGIQSRGSVIAIGEYGAHGKVGGAWYSRDFGEHFYHVFEHSMYAPNYPNAHIHGICVDPYFDRMYIITGDSGKNSRIYWWDYNGETLSDNLYNTIQWNYIETNMEYYTGCNFQFVCGYALKDCVILGSDGMRGGIMRINRGRKEDTPIIDFGVDFGYAKDGQFSTVWCGGNMFKLDDDSPLLICIHREASNDLEPDDPNNPSHYANTYRTVLSKVYATYNGYDFSLLWVDDTYGQYDVWETDDNWATQTVVQKNLAKCGRDMSVYQLPDKTILLKYIGRSQSYVSYNDNGVTKNTKSIYHRFNNYVVKGHLK